MMHITKNLATCKPSEFLRQTNRIRKSIENWLSVTDILNIRKQIPTVKNDATTKERDNAVAEQMKRNMSAILDSVLDEHPDETLEVLALMCFIEPEDVDNYPVGEYLRAFSELISDKDVLSFFTSLTRLGQTGILT